jgi:hypothetical protein
MYTPKDLSERYGWSINVCRELIKTIPGALNRGLSNTKPRYVVSTANLLRWEEGEAFGQAPAPIREPAPLRRPRFKEVIYPKNRTAAEERARLARLGETLQ